MGSSGDKDGADTLYANPMYNASEGARTDNTEDGAGATGGGGGTVYFDVAAPSDAKGGPNQTVYADSAATSEGARPFFYSSHIRTGFSPCH